MTSYLTLMNSINQEIQQVKDNGPKEIRDKVTHELEHARDHLDKARMIIRDYIAEDVVKHGRGP